MANVSDIEPLVRYQLGDFSHNQIPGDIFTYNTSAIFTMSEPNVIAVTKVLVDDSELSDSEYAVDTTSNKITISASLSSGDVVEIQYTYYPNYSITEITSYIRAAAVLLSVNNYYTYEIDTNGEIYPEPTNKEINLIAFIAAVLIEPNNESYRLPDISITVPHALPTRDIISKALSIFKKNTHGIFAIVHE